MDNTGDIKRFFLIVLIGSLLIMAATSILIFLFGSFNEVEVRILMTMASISAASLFGILFSKLKTDYVRILGITLIGIMFAITVGTIWEILDEEFFYKGFLTSLILIVLLIQSPWVLRPQNNKTLRSVAIGTFISASIVALMVIQLILDFMDFEEFYFRVLGVFGVLYLLGLILGPILKKILPRM
ncbi:MAG: hypothetical protein KKF50_03790 [Nanoarchaeota archaeon]|nr:hypothetical protein [Nanoarchaeota archaeon]